MLNLVSKDISSSIIFVETTFEIWNDLKDSFQQSNGPRIFQLCRDLLNLNQAQNSVSVYFTQLKSLWEELSHFRPAYTCGKCTCEGVQPLTSHYQMEYIMSFLMDLNDSYAQVRGQLLLIDPLPPINKVFSLVTQEEHQRQVGSQSILAIDSTNSIAFAVSHEWSPSLSYVPKGPNHTRGPKKERPFCTHCQYHGHTVEKCYKLHGYPPGFKQQKRTTNVSGNNIVVANQVSTQSSEGTKTDKDNTNISSFFQHLNSAQCHQLMIMLSTHLVQIIDSNDCPFTSYAGTCFSVSVSHILSSFNTWIFDSGASRHICPIASQFINMVLFLIPMFLYQAKLLFLFILVGTLGFILICFLKMFCLCLIFSLICCL